MSLIQTPMSEICAPLTSWQIWITMDLKRKLLTRKHMNDWRNSFWPKLHYVGWNSDFWNVESWFRVCRTVKQVKQLCDLVAVLVWGKPRPLLDESQKLLWIRISVTRHCTPSNLRMKGSGNPWVKCHWGRTKLPDIPISAGFRTRERADDVPRSVIHSCCRKALLKCKTDPFLILKLGICAKR